MKIQTYRLTETALADKTDKAGKYYEQLVNPIHLQMLTGHEGQNLRLTYEPYWHLKDAHGGQGERQLIPEVDKKPSLMEKMFQASALTQDQRDIRTYEAEELRLVDRHHIPAQHVESILYALEEVLGDAIGHLEVIGMAAGAESVETTLGVEYLLDKAALNRAASENEKTEYRTLIRVMYREIKLTYPANRILA